MNESTNPQNVNLVQMIVDALAVADARHLHDVGIALEMARLSAERAVVSLPSDGVH